MRIYAFDWDEKNEAHIASHGVAVFEVEEAILFDKPFYQRSRECKYVVYATTEEVRFLFIVFVIKGRGRIRVITNKNYYYGTR